MYGSGYEFLARAAFPRDQYRAVGRRNPPYQFIHISHLFTLPHDDVCLIFCPQLHPEVLVLNYQILSFQSTAHRYPEDIRSKRLGDIIIGPQLYCFYCGFDRRVTGHDEDRQSRILFFEPLERLNPSHAGHLQIEENKVKGFTVKSFYRLLP